MNILQEFCILYKLSTPCYNIVNTSGPAHLSVFTVRCNVGNEYKEASAATKKVAKQKAAQEVLQCIKKRVNFCDVLEEITVDQLDIEFKDLSLNECLVNNTSTDEVIALYHTKKNMPVVNNHQLITNNHKMLTDLCSNIPLEQKVCLLFTCEREKCYSDDLSKLEHIIYKALNVSIERIIFTTKGNVFMIGLRLATMPIIFQMGIGKTKNEAERHALCNLFKYINVFLKKHIYTQYPQEKMANYICSCATIRYK